MKIISGISCVKCGGKLYIDQEENAPKCVICGFVHSPTLGQKDRGSGEHITFPGIQTIKKFTPWELEKKQVKKKKGGDQSQANLKEDDVKDDSLESIEAKN